MATIYTVSQLNNEIKDLLDAVPGYRGLMVQGEISNYKAHSSGHHYMTLKDENAAINAVMFRSDAMRLKFRLQNGMKVIVKARVSSFPRTGAVQLYVSEIIPDGAGALNLAFEQLKAKLQAEGLFSERYKKPIPSCLDSIALVTSPTGAAVRDMIRILGRRWPLAKVVLYPAQVQGQGAAESIARAIALANAIGEADVILCGRGGGSMEDLWAFNEESVARAIFASELPVISAVGHETDFTIADFVSDLRAPTPSAAAELATTRLADKKEDARALAERLERDMQAVLTVSKRRLEFLKERPVLKRPLELMQKKERVLAEQERLLYKETAGQLQRLSRGLLAAEGRLAAVSPFSVMNRGYAMLMDEGGTPLTTAQAAKVGQAVRIRMKDGILQAEVTGKAVFADGEKETNL